MKRFYLAEILNISIKLNSQVIIYSDFRSKRLQYTLELVFEQLLGINFSFTDNFNDCHLIYSKTKTNKKAVNISICSDLLNNTGFEPIDVNFKNTGEKTLLFLKENENALTWEFDLFSAVFYLVSRYEEYKGFTPDVHKRFPPEASILFKTESLEFPLVNIWSQKLKEELKLQFSELEFNIPKFRFISTIDVDSTFRFREKGFFRASGGFLKDLKNMNFGEVLDRIKTVSGIVRDSFDVFEKVDKLHTETGVEVIFFWLLGDFRGYDKNISWKNKKQGDIIRNLAKKYKIGIHPSYRSNTDKKLVLTEKNRLEQICNSTIEISRQHFLVHKFPETYQTLINAGIKTDFTLGYTSFYGFRAGIASPFYFYDLSNETTTQLMLYPFCSMDITPMFYFALSTENAIEKNRKLLKRVKEVNGLFISLWHNESISGTTRWQGGWDIVYEQLVKDASEILKN